MLQPWNRTVFVADYDLDGRQLLLVLGTIDCILRTWQQRDRTLGFFYRGILLAEYSMNERKRGRSKGVIRGLLAERLEQRQHLLSSGSRAGNIAGIFLGLDQKEWIK